MPAQQEGTDGQVQNGCHQVLALKPLIQADSSESHRAEGQAVLAVHRNPAGQRDRLFWPLAGAEVDGAGRCAEFRGGGLLKSGEPDRRLKGGVSASFRNQQKVAGLESTLFPCPWERFLPESATAFLPSSNWGQEPSRPGWLTQDSHRQPTSRSRIDDPLSFRGSWISNRQVSSVFAPSLTVVAWNR